MEAPDGCTCLVVDRPGTGLNQACPDLTDNQALLGVAHRFVEDVPTGMGQERGHVVASSLGGFIALRSAAATPDRFERTVQMACPALVPGMLVPTFMRLTTRTWFHRLTNPFPSDERSANRILPQLGHGAGFGASRLSQSLTDWHILWGADDGSGDEDVARNLERLMPDVRLEMIPRSGHLPWLDFPAEIARIPAFLDEGA